MRSVLISVRHSPLDARLERWSRLLGAAGPHERWFLQSTGGALPSRLAFLRDSWRALRKAEVWVLPDPQLHLIYPVIRLIRRSAVIVLDIHEDYHLTAEIRPGRLPWLTRRLVAAAARSYRIARQRGDLVVVAAEIIDVGGADLFDNGNATPDFQCPVPPLDRAVYIGDLTVERGAYEIVALARTLPNLRIELVGRTPVNEELKAAIASEPNIRYHGQLDFESAIKIAAQCGIGLSLLQDLPPYRDAQPTKLFDYASLGHFLIVTPLPGQAQLVEEHDIGLVLTSFHVDDATGEHVRDAINALNKDFAARAHLVERSRGCHAERMTVIEAQWEQIRSTIERTVSARSQIGREAPTVKT